MSAPAINPAPSPTPGAGSSAAAANGVQAAHAAQAQDPLAAFEAMLATLFGAKSPATGDTAAPGAKTATDAGKTKGKTAGDDKTAAADGTTTAANPNLALLVPVAANLPAAAPATQAAGDTASAPVASVAPAADKAADATAAESLAQLAGSAVAEPDGGKATLAAAQAAAIPADAAAANANATAKTDATPAPKVEVAAAPQAPATPTAPPVATAQPDTSSAAATAAAQAAQAPEKTAEAAPPVVAKERVQAIKTSTRIDGVKTAAATATAPGGIAALTAKAADALQTIADKAPKGGFDERPAEQPLVEARTDEAAPARSDPATATTITPSTLTHAAAVAVRGAPQTVANLAAQIVKKLDGRSSQFDVQLDPIGLGKVDVRIAIGSDGRMSAAMSFDTPQAAAELKARAGELHQAMAQAGFDLTGGMSFDVASDRGQGQGNQAQQQQPEAGAAFRGRAFQAALDTTADTPPPQYALRRAALAGVDIRI